MAGALAAKYATWFSAFLVASCGMVLCNKAVMHVFHYSFMLLLFQNMMTVLLNAAGVQVGLFSIKAFTKEQFRQFVVPTIIFTLMLVTSLRALPLVAVATVVVFRNVGTCVVALGDCYIFKKSFNDRAKLALGTIVVGSCVYAATDINYDFWGYVWVLTNTALVVANQLYEKYAVVNMDQTAVGISCIQNLLSMPVLIFFGLALGEGAALSQFLDLSGGYKSLVVVTGFLGCALSICYMSLSKFASATAITVGNNFNKAVSVALGALVFRTALSWLQIVGLAMAMVGAFMFSMATMRKPASNSSDAPPTKTDEEV